MFLGTKGPGNESSQELSFPGNESSRERKGPGTKVRGNFRSHGTKVPRNEKSRERKFPIGTIRSWERKVLGTKSPGTEVHHSACSNANPTLTLTLTLILTLLLTLTLTLILTLNCYNAFPMPATKLHSIVCDEQLFKHRSFVCATTMLTLRRIKVNFSHKKIASLLPTNR